MVAGKGRVIASKYKNLQLPCYRIHRRLVIILRKRILAPIMCFHQSDTPAFCMFQLVTFCVFQLVMRPELEKSVCVMPMTAPVGTASRGVGVFVPAIGWMIRPQVYGGPSPRLDQSPDDYTTPAGQDAIIRLCFYSYLPYFAPYKQQKPPIQAAKCLKVLASPTGFEPVLPA
jgi:hypothetical protein